MCARSPKPIVPKVPELTAEEKAEQEAAKLKEKQERDAAELEAKREKEKNRQDALEQKVKETRGGSGAQSLLTGSKGGIGYFDGRL